MNIVQLQDQLKNFSQDQLIREMQMPSGTAPQFLVLGEIMRRQKMQKDFAAQQAKGEPQGTVAEEAIAASGVPQGGIADMARAMAPKTDMAQSTGVQAMATGGPVKKMAEGDRVVIGGVVYIEQADGSLRSASGATPPAATAGRGGGAPGAMTRPITPLEGTNGFQQVYDLSQQAYDLFTTPVDFSPETMAREARADEAAAVGAPELQNPALRAAMAERATPEAEAAADAATDQNQPTSPGGGAGGGAGGMTSFEQEIMNAIQRREKAAEQDKWLALAQVGLNLMSSTNATPLGALGEAGIAGVEAARTARDQYDKDRMDLMTALEQSRQARAAAAARAARGNGGIRPLTASGIMTQQKYMLDLAESRLASLTGGQDPASFAAMLSEAAQGGDTMAASQLMALDAAQKQYESAYGNYMSAANQLGALTMTAPEEDDTQFSAADQ